MKDTVDTNNDAEGSVQLLAFACLVSASCAMFVFISADFIQADLCAFHKGRGVRSAKPQRKLNKVVPTMLIGKRDKDV